MRSAENVIPIVGRNCANCINYGTVEKCPLYEFNEEKVNKKNEIEQKLSINGYCDQWVFAYPIGKKKKKS